MAVHFSISHPIINFTCDIISRTAFVTTSTSTTHHCIKLETDVLLCVLHIDEVPRPLLRIAEDGITDIAIKANDLLSRELGALNHVTVSVLVTEKLIDSW